MIRDVIQNILISSLYTTFFAGIFILLRNVLFKYIGARWNYYLWFIIFIPWFSVWLPLNFLSDVEPGYYFNTIVDHINTQLQLESTYFRFSLENIIFAIWSIGFIFTSTYLLLRHFQFITILKKHSKALSIPQKSIVKDAIVNKDLIPLSRICISTLLSSPMICHVVNSKIYLPENYFLEYSKSEQKYILQHECVHYQRCDLIANTAMLLLTCLNWFNPIMIFSYRYFRCAQELSCDAILNQQFTSAEKKAYGYALLKSAFQPSSQISNMTCWWNSGKQLKERCSMLKYHHSKPMRNLLGIFVLATATGIAIAAPNLQKNDNAVNMKISNSSKNNLTFSIENVCSEEIGVVNAHSVKVVPRKRINNACRTNPTNCETQVYDTADCSGNSIATIIFDVTDLGAKAVIPHTNSYHIGISGFNLFIEGPWATTGNTI